MIDDNLDDDLDEMDFDDEMDDLSSGIDDEMDYDDEPPRRFLRWPVIRRSGVATVIICASVVGAFFLLAGASGPFIIHGAGPGVEDLEVEARVVASGQEVGQVTGFRFEGSEQVAVMHMSNELRGQLGKGTRFVVASVNKWVPGNVGVILDPVEPVNSDDRIESGDKVRLEKVVVAGIPPSAWLGLGLIVGVCIVTFVLFAIIKKLVVIALGIGGLVLLVSYFYGSVDSIDFSQLQIPGLNG